MKDSAASATPVDDQGRLLGDFACQRCGYNLRSLLPTGICVECGTPIARSLHGRNLAASDPRWLDVLASGFVILWISALIAAGAAVLTVVRESISTLPVWLDATLSALMFVTGVVGCWRLTTPEPDALKPERPINARIIFRYAFGIAVVGSFFLAVVPTWFGLSMSSRLFNLVTIALALCGAIGLGALLVHVHDLARRLNDRGLALLAIMAEFTLVVTVIGFAVFASNFHFKILHSQLLGPLVASNFGVMVAHSIVRFASYWGAAVFSAMLLVLLPLFWKRIADTAALARRTWASPSPTPTLSSSLTPSTTPSATDTPRPAQ